MDILSSQDKEITSSEVLEVVSYELYEWSIFH